MTLPFYRIGSAYSLEPRPCGLANMWLVYPSPSQLALTNPYRYRNINLFAIAYAFQPQLRFRLTLGGLSCPRNPWVYGDRGSHSVYRYSCQHNHSMSLQQALRSTFTGEIDAPLPRPRDELLDRYFVGVPAFILIRYPVVSGVVSSI
jgi:hypothetical protein